MAAPKPNSMRTQPLGQAIRHFGAALVGRLWIALAVALFVALGALVLYAAPSASWRHAYMATQNVRIVVLTSSASTSYDDYLSQREAESIARGIASGAVFTSYSFQEAVMRTLAAQHDTFAAHFGADTPRTVTASDIAASLSATHTADVISLACHWNTAAGANALLISAVAVLTASDDVRSLLPSEEAAQQPNAALARTASAISPARLDPAAATTAWHELVVRIALGACFGLITALLLAGLSIRDTAIHAHSRTADATPASKR